MKRLCKFNLEAPVLAMRVHPRLDRLVCFPAARDDVGSYDDVVLFGWDLGRLELIAKYEKRPREAVAVKEWMRGWFGDVAFHPSDENMALVANYGQPIDICNTIDGGIIRSISCGHYYHSFVFSGNDYLIADAKTAQPLEEPYEHRTEVFDYQTGALIGSFFAASLLVNHPDGELIATALNDQGGATVRFVRLTEPFQGNEDEFERKLPQGDEDEFGWDPPRVRVSDEEDYFGWWPPSGLNISGMKFSPPGDAFAIIGVDPGINILNYDFPSLRERFSVEIDPKPELAEWMRVLGLPIESVAFSPDGSRLYVPLLSGFVSERDARTGLEVGRWKAHQGPILSLDARPGDFLMVTSSVDGEVSVWDLER